MNTLKIMLVDDHPLFRKGLSSLINAEPKCSVIADVASPSEAIEVIRNQELDFVIVDLSLGNYDGLELIKNIQAINKDIRILVMSMHDERYYAERAIKAGAKGYVMKDQAGKVVIQAIQSVMKGNIWLSDKEKARIHDYMAERDSLQTGEEWLASMSKLSDRQLQIFNLIGKGLGTIEIAGSLQVSTKTVDTHKEHIKQKLHCGSTQELRQLAIEWAKHVP